MNPSPPIPLRDDGAGVVLQVKVHPRARRTRLEGVVGEALKISLTAPADQGKANRALQQFLSEIFDIPHGSIHILGGLTSPRKVIRLEGLTAAQVQTRLLERLGSRDGR